MRIQEYLDARGRSPFARWFGDLDAQAAAKIAIALTRIEHGNLGSLKRLSGGLFELRLDFGPGYRVYLGREGDQLIILLGGGNAGSRTISTPPTSVGLTTAREG